MKKIYSFYFVLVIFLFLSSIPGCKESTIEPVLFGKINGTVLDAQTGAAIINASVSTNPPTVAIVTDNSGKFSMNNVPVGNYTINISKTGYKKGVVTISVLEDITVPVTILMEKDTPGNNAPNPPSNPVPSNGATNQPNTITLKWSGSDPDNDLLLFDVFLFESESNQKKILENKPDTLIEISDLKFNTTYFWQVIAKDTTGLTSNGEVWSFKTRDFPDNRIVFASERDGNFEIYSTDTSEANTIRLTNNSSRDYWPRLNPRQKKIAFSSDKNIEPHIYTINSDGTGLFKVTSIPIAGFHNYGRGFCWLPDGGSLLYSSYDKLYKIDENGGNLTLIATAPAGRNFREVEYSPAGNKIVAVTVGQNVYDTEIYLMDSDGSNMVQLIGNLPGIVESPSFSPDGNKIVFTHDISGHESATGRQLNSRIFIVDINSTDTTDISKNKVNGTNDLYPRFSPDGASIIFTNAKNDGTGIKSIWLMDINGDNRKLIISDGIMADWK